MAKAKVLKALTAAVFLVVAASLSAVAAAEKREQTCVKKNFRTASKTTIAIGDVPNHEVSQEMSVADMEFSNPDFKVKDEWTYIHSDTIDGSGVHSGYFMDTHMDGSTDYGVFKGAVKTTVKGDGSWEANWEGTYQYLGGSGKFRNLRGNGQYKGKASSTEPALEQCRETVEY